MRDFKRLAVVLALFSAAHALAYVPLTRTHTTPDSTTYLASGQALLHGSYSTPLRANIYYAEVPGAWVDRTLLQLPPRVWDAPERQTFRTPAYPIVIAAVGGGSGFSRYVLYLVQALMIGAAVFLLIHGLALITPPGVALLAGAVYALDPFSKRYASLVMTEATTALLVMATFYFLARAIRKRSLAAWAASGAAAGATTLARPIFVIMIPLLLVAALVFTNERKRLATLAVVGSSLIVLAPWLAWTTSVVGRPALSTYTEGQILLEAAWGQGLHRTTSALDRDPRLVREISTVHRFAPPLDTLLRDPNAHPRYLDRSDSELRRLALNRYADRLEKEPAAVLWNFAYRSYFLWMAHEDWYQPSGGPLLLALRLPDWITLALALLGAVIAPRRYGATAACIPVFLFLYMLVTVFHSTEARYGIPVRGLYLSLAVIGAIEVARKFGLRRGGISPTAA